MFSKLISHRTVLVGLMVYAVIVAVTFGFSMGGHYKASSGVEGEDFVTSATIPPEEGYSTDTATAATPAGTEGESVDRGGRGSLDGFS